MALAIAAYFYFRKEKKQTLKDILGSEQFKQGQQGSVEESATEPQVEQSTTEEVKTEPQLPTEEDEKK